MKLQIVREEFPQVSVRERDRRWSALREAMSQRGVDCLLLNGTSARWNEMNANIRYVCNYGDPLSTMSYALFPLSGEGTLLLQMSLKRSVLAQCWFTDVRNRETGRVSEIVAERLGALGLAKGILGLVSVPFGANEQIGIPYQVFRDLQRLLPNLKVVDATDLLVQMRAVKSQEELECLEKSAELCDLAFRTKVVTARPGISERQVGAAMVQAVQAAGADPPTLMLLNSGPMPREELMGDPLFSGRILQKGDIITSEIGPKWAGYQAQTMQCVSLGAPTRELRELARYGIEVFNRVAEHLRPGTDTEDATHAGDTVIEGARERLGALADGLRPLIHESGLGGPDPRPRPWHLKPNQAYMVEIGPGTVQPQHVYVGNCYAITEGGPRALNKIPPEEKILVVVEG